MDKNRESDDREEETDETDETKGRSVTGILAVIGGIFVLVVAMQMCQ
jgi:hypothetical protein